MGIMIATYEMQFTEMSKEKQRRRLEDVWT